MIDSKTFENDDYEHIELDDVNAGDVYEQNGITNKQRREVLNTHSGCTSTQGPNVTETVKVRLSEKIRRLFKGHCEHNTISRISCNITGIK